MGQPSRRLAGYPAPNKIGTGGDTRRSETSQYPQEEKSVEIPPVVASESGRGQTGELALRGCRTRTLYGNHQRNDLESSAIARESRVRENHSQHTGILSTTGHVKPSRNPGGPPSNPKYKTMTDSGQVPRGKGEKNRC